MWGRPAALSGGVPTKVETSLVVAEIEMVLNAGAGSHACTCIVVMLVYLPRFFGSMVAQAVGGGLG